MENASLSFPITLIKVSGDATDLRTSELLSDSSYCNVKASNVLSLREVILELSAETLTSTLHIQQNRNILRNGPYDLSSIQGKIRYLSECLHSTGNGLKEGRIWFVAASDILRSLDKTSAECLQTLRSVLGQLLSMGVQTNAEKRMTLLDSSIKHIKELHRSVLF